MKTSTVLLKISCKMSKNYSLVCITALTNKGVHDK